MPSCRSVRSASAAVSRSTVSVAVAPAASSASPSGPYATFANDWVATAPTPARAHGTTAPTARNFDCTATARSPVAASRATIENVIGWPSVPDPRIGDRVEHVDDEVHDDDADRSEQHGPHDERHICGA